MSKQVPSLKSSTDTNQDTFKATIHDAYSTTSDFATLVHKSWYVDKTLLIKAVFKDMDKILITAPRQFGKSTNMNMLKNFFGVEKYHQWNLNTNKAGYLEEEQPNSETFNLFKGTKIFTVEDNGKQVFDKKFFTNHFGRYPTIHVDFKDVKGNTYDEILDSLRAVIHDCFLQHSYLEECYKKYGRDHYIHKYQSLNVEEIQEGLKYLTELLCKYFGYRYYKKAYVLIDNYDAPISNAIFNNISESDLRKTVTIISALISSLLKDNPHVEIALLTGCLHVGNVLSPNNVAQHPFLQSQIFGDFYGFTGDEVEHLLNKKGLLKKIREVKEWYKGYNRVNRVEIYNNWSIINYLRTNEIQNFWSAGSFNELFVSILKRKFPVEVKSLMRQQVATIKYQEKLEIMDIITLQKIINLQAAVNKKDSSLFLQFLYENGYLNPINRIGRALLLKFPNEEVYTEICQSLFSLDFFIKYYETDREAICTFLESARNLLKKDNREESFIHFANSIKNLYNRELLTWSHFEFQSYIFYLLSDEFENTKGLAILTQPKSVYNWDIATIINETGIVIQLKILDNGNSVDALNEILDNNCYSVIDDEDVINKIYLGIHMDKKKNITITYLINSLDKKLAKTVCSA